jgi:hypothetical protein
MPMRELSKNELAEMVSAMKRPDKLDPLPAGFYPMPLALSQDDPEWRVIGLVTNGHSPREALPYRESALDRLSGPGFRVSRCICFR